MPCFAAQLSRTGRSIFRHLVGGMLLILLLFALAPTRAEANCTYYGGSNPPATVSFAPTTTVNIPATYVANAVIYTSATVAPSGNVEASCTNNTLYGVNDSIGTTPGSGATIYPTGLSGVGYTLLHASAPPGTTSDDLGPYNYSNAGAANTWEYSVDTTLELIQTGPIPNGSVLPAGQIGNWEWGTLVIQNFTLANSVTFVGPACTIVTNPIVVTLPDIPTSALSATQLTAGSTPFTISLNCPSGSDGTLQILLSSSTLVTGSTSVIKNTGTATGVGVQVLNSSSQPVNLTSTTPTTIGTVTAGGSLSISYYGQYYYTGPTVAAGTVSATATFVVSYQ